MHITRNFGFNSYIPICPKPINPHVASRCSVVEKARADSTELVVDGQRRRLPGVRRRAALGKEHAVRTLIAKFVRKYDGS